MINLTDKSNSIIFYGLNVMSHLKYDLDDHLKDIDIFHENQVFGINLSKPIISDFRLKNYRNSINLEQKSICIKNIFGYFVSSLYSKSKDVNRLNGIY